MLNELEWNVLEFLIEQKEPVTSGTIIRALKKGKGNRIYITLNSLEHRGYIERVQVNRGSKRVKWRAKPEGGF